MPLSDYQVRRDKFRYEEPGGIGFDFPCCVCVHRRGQDTDEPCRTCDHNAGAVPMEEADKRNEYADVR